jgi:hypothetical protein
MLLPRSPKLPLHPLAFPWHPRPTVGIGTLPPSWGALTKLRKCWVYNNTLSGPLPGAWSGMAALEDLRLAMNRLTGGAGQWVEGQGHQCNHSSWRGRGTRLGATLVHTPGCTHSSLTCRGFGGSGRSVCVCVCC